LSECNILIGATDSNRSRVTTNAIALKLNIPVIFGCVFTAAGGGEVIFVNPQKNTPCLACVQLDDYYQGLEEEVTSLKQAQETSGAYVAPSEIEAKVQVGLAADIAPISNLMVKLCLGFLSGEDNPISEIEEPYFLWANNRRIAPFDKYERFGKGPGATILRWYSIPYQKNPECPACSSIYKLKTAFTHLFSPA